MQATVILSKLIPNKAGKSDPSFFDAHCETIMGQPRQDSGSREKNCQMPIM
uniref:Uncharacterized protein n=1 Tax=Arundo donax TaxID=35708 RepID=A0A0A8ZP29_ARUDO